MRHQADNPFVNTGPTQKTSAIERMKPTIDEIWRVADIVQPRSCDKDVRVIANHWRTCPAAEATA